MKYIYYVATMFYDKQHVTPGINTAEVTRTEKITTYEDVKGIADQIRHKNGFYSAAVINYILLREEEGE